MYSIKIIHLSCVVLSFLGFFIRGLLMIKASAVLGVRWIKIAPHLVDSVLLVSAFMLASQWGRAAFQQTWLQAKILALLVYIVLGMLALREGRPQAVRVSAWLGAMMVFVYIVLVAITKKPLPG